MTLSSILQWLERVILGPAPTPAPPSPTPPPPPPAPPQVTALVAAINVQRAAYSLCPLAESGTLDTLAHSRSESMAAMGGLSDAGFNLQVVPQLAGLFPGYAAAAENVAEGQPDVASVIDAWMNSLPHRANILGPYNLIGAGIVTDASGRVWWTNLFVAQR